MRSRILLVEADPEDRANLSLLLTQENYDVTTVGESSAAAAIIHCDVDTEREFDAIISSTNLPGCGSRNVCLELEEKFGCLPLIFLSEMTDIVETGEFFGKPLLQKPVSGSDLARAVKTAVREQKNRKTKKLMRAGERLSTAS